MGKPSKGLRRGRRPRLLQVSGGQFFEARRAAGMTRLDAAEFLGVSLRTVGQWETERHRVPYAAFKLLRVYRHGDLIDPAWAGYRLIRGKLVTPENHTFGPADMSWLSLLVRRAAAFSDLLAQRDGRTPTERQRRGVPAVPPALQAAACIASPHPAQSDGSGAMPRVVQPRPPLPRGDDPHSVQPRPPLPTGDDHACAASGGLPPSSNTGMILQPARVAGGAA